MSFVSIPFFVFFAVVLILQCLLRKPRARHVVLLAASYVFYGWWDWRFCGLMLFVTAIAYVTALAIERRRGDKAPLVIGVVAPLAALFVFKYANFFLDGFCALFRIQRASALRIILPVGISFYTFQSLSYTIDVYRGKLRACRDPVRFALYVSFFPQLVAGPIVKANEFMPQLDEDRRPTPARVSRGLTEFFFGAFKKAVLADNIAVFSDAVFGAVGAYGSATVALAVVAYALQIYFDFSGYSDMATGAARCLGYDLPVNFDLPYIARNVSEFWKRWHISLSSWLMQYLYIPLGGNRRGKVRTYVNLMVTMILGGLWHGADMSFVIWGLLHGAALCAHKAYSRRHPPKPGRWRRAAASALTVAWVTLLWVFFRAENMGHAMLILRRLFQFAPGVEQLSVWTIAGVALLAGGTFWCARGCRSQADGVHGRLPDLALGTFWGALGFTLLAGFTIILMYTGVSPFIYFQF
ncbi:MAG: MBOAT family protein [Clostridia bacterium]|nr:MBOAT family protein [Clostridia bacterium]